MPGTSAVAGSGALRVVLFGMPGAGKTSLVGALAQAAQSQAHMLHGQLADPSGGLDEVKKLVYDNQARPAGDEATAYLLNWEPAPDAHAKSAQVLLIDCDGRKAHELLARPRGLHDGGGELAREILQADSIILAVDATGSMSQTDFNNFAIFLKAFEEHRGKHTEVSGLPVYLVLTKADLLAKKGESAGEWIARIEERKRKFDRWFQDQLAQQGKRDGMSFGKIDLHVWATAVQRPALADRPTKGHEPYGVAELFRQCLESARSYHDARQESGRLLRRAVLGMLVLVGVMAAFAALFFLTRPSAEAVKLENEIRNLLPKTITAAEKLRDSDKKLKELAKLQENPEYAKLSSETRDRLESYFNELEAYQKFIAQVTDLPDPIKAPHTEDNLKKIDRQLEKIKPPTGYFAEWSQTAAGKVWGEYKADIATLEREIGVAEKTFKSLIDRYEDLKNQKLTRAEYDDKVKELIQEGRKLPYLRVDRGMPFHGSRASPELVLRFERVAPLHLEWKRIEEKSK